MLSHSIAIVSTDRRFFMKGMYLLILCFSRIRFLSLTKKKLNERVFCYYKKKELVVHFHMKHPKKMCFQRKKNKSRFLELLLQWLHMDLI